MPSGVIYSPRAYSGSYEDPTSSSEPLYDYVGPAGPTGPTGPTGPAGPATTDFDNGNAFTVYSVADFDFESGDA
jgi:hypothetical protein